MFPHSADDILRVLDLCASDCSFPMLDNGYIYLAATRLSLFRSDSDWAVCTEVFGFSPRTGVPSTCVSTFASSLINRIGPEGFASLESWRAHLDRKPNDEALFLYPIEGEDWIVEESLKPDMRQIQLRDRPVFLPNHDDYQEHGIDLEELGTVKVFEFCRWLAAKNLDHVLATDAEQRHHLPDSLVKIMQLDEWHHPDTAVDQLPSDTETFRQLAEVLVTGELNRYKPTEPPNTHWSNWPAGGTL